MVTAAPERVVVGGQLEEVLSGTILDEAQDIVDLPVYANILFYGENGTGKTTLTGTGIEDDCVDLLPDGILYLEVEGGRNALRNKKGIKVLTLRNWETLQKIYEALFYMTTSPETWTGRRYSMVVVDSLTELEARARKEILAEAHAKNAAQDPEIASQREWGKAQERIKNMVRAFRDLDMHFVAIFLEATKELDSGMTRVYPDVPGKLAGQVSAYFDVVGRLWVDSREENAKGGGKITIDERRMLFAKTKRYDGKDRLNVLPRVMVSPTMNKIMRPILTGDQSPERIEQDKAQAA